MLFGGTAANRVSQNRYHPPRSGAERSVDIAPPGAERSGAELGGQCIGGARKRNLARNIVP